MQVSDIPIRYHPEIFQLARAGRSTRKIAASINERKPPKPITHGGVGRLLEQFKRTGYRPGDAQPEIPEELLPPAIPTDKSGMIEVRVPIDLIDEDDPDEIRQKLDPAKLRNRIDGIRETGRPWAPIFVFKKTGGRFGRVGGNYRTTAYRRLLEETGEDRWKSIPAYIVGGDQLDLDIMRLADNAAREDNTPYEIARHLHRLKTTYKISAAALIVKFGKVGLSYSVSHIDLMTRLQENLASEVLAFWRDQLPFATIPRLMRLLELGGTPEGKQRQVELVTRMIEDDRPAEWIEAQLDKLKDPSKPKRGPKSDSIGIKRSQVLIVREQIEKSRMAIPIKRATIALIDAITEGQETFTLGGILINLPTRVEAKQREIENGARTDVSNLRGLALQREAKKKKGKRS